MDTRNRNRFDPPTLEMTLTGEFRDQPGAPIVTKIGHMALIVAVLATAGAMALLALWFALAMIPIAIGAGLVAYAALRFQRWRGQSALRR